MKSFILLILGALGIWADEGALAQFARGGRVEVPAIFHENSPEVQVTMPGSSRVLRFAVDTGSSFTLLDTAVAAKLGLNATGESSITGAGSGAIKTGVVKNQTFQLPGLTLKRFDVLLTDLSALAAQGRPLDGIFGYDFFSKLIVTIDEDRQMLVLTDPAKFEYLGAGEVLPLTFGGGRGKWIYVPGSIKVAGIPAETLAIFVDTGSSDAVDTELLKKSKAALKQTQTGEGLGKSHSGIEGRVEWLRLGRFELRNAPSVCCGNPGNENMIGGAVLRHFIVTLDYPGKRMILEEGKRLRDPF
jgi:predicted aspartyl protease